MKWTRIRSCCCGGCLGVALIICVFYIFIMFRIWDESLSNVIVFNAIETIQSNIDEHKRHEMYRNTQLFIGLGAQKGASTYFQNLLNKTMKFIMRRQQKKENITYTIKQELHYWDDCILNQYVPSSMHVLNEYLNLLKKKRLQNWKSNKTQRKCDFNQYIKLFGSNTVDMNAVALLSEKTPSYFRYYHSCFALSFYAHIYDISFYVLLRNPIYRVWSMYWMNVKLRKQTLNSSDLVDIHLMNGKIQEDIDLFPTQYPLFDAVLSMLDTADETHGYNWKIVESYIKAVYDPYLVFDIPFLMIGCYYPQLVMWLYTFHHIVPKHWNFNSNSETNYKLHFKILQSEMMLSQQQNTMKEFVCWMMNGDDHEEKCSEMQRLLNGPSAKLRLFSRSKLKRRKYESYAPAPNIMDVMNLSVAHSLSRFYLQCNQKLYSLLQQNPDLLLGDAPFSSW